jgi:hypothetical protein
MKILKWLTIIVLFFVVLPTIATVAVIKYLGTPLVNALLQTKVNAPVKVKKVSTDWFLTQLVIENLLIENPKGFPPGDLLKIPYLKVEVNPKTYISFQPYISINGKGIYFHFIRKEDNFTNVAVAFGLPVEKAKVDPLEFEIKNFTTTVKVATLKDISYIGKGKFVGLHNNADFAFNGTGDISDTNNPLTVTDFVVYNWRIRNNKYLNKLADLLHNPSLREITLTKIEGRIKTEADWVIFADRNTKAYTVGDILFAEIYKGSKYNRKTKELDIKMALYLPMKVEIHITGTSEEPKIEIENLKGLIPTNNLLPKENVLQKTLEKPLKNATGGEVIQEPLKHLQNATKKVKETVEKSLKELQEGLNKAFKGLIGN